MTNPYAMDELTNEDCISGPEFCSGRVEYRMTLSIASHPRCDKHWNDRLDLEQRLRRAYPDTDTPPAWFDPSYAGEHWNY